MNEIQEKTPLNRQAQNAGAVVSSLAISVLLIYLAFAVSGLDSELTALITIGAALLCSVCLCLAILRKYRRAGNPPAIDYLNICTQRYVLSILMVLYGIDKLLGNFFDYQMFALDSRLADVSEFQLAWFFYGKNRWQELLAGVLEFVPGLFLLYRRTYYVAALILLPVTAQVFLLNLFFKIGGVTFPVSGVLLACDIYILYSQKEKIILFFRSLHLTMAAPVAGTARNTVKVLKVSGISLIALLVFLKVRPALFRSPYQRAYAGLVGVYSLKEMKKNGVPYVPVGDSFYYKDLYIEKQARWNILRTFSNTTEAFVLNISAGNDSIGIYLNRGGIGDGPDIIDPMTALRGTYERQGKRLLIRGTQLNNTLDLVYEKQERVKPKSWFW